MSTITRKLTVCGSVQMVGYRWFAKQQADIFDIKGYVRNTGRGDVEVLAQGDEEAVMTYIDHLKAGPSRARVDRVINEPLLDDKVYKEFMIRM